MKIRAILAAIAVAASVSPAALAGNQVVCTAKVKPNGTTQAVVGNYSLAWQSKVGQGNNEWHATGNGNTFTHGGSTMELPAGDTCAIFRDGVLDKSDPFNVSNGTAANGLPFDAAKKFSWPN